MAEDGQDRRELRPLCAVSQLEPNANPFIHQSHRMHALGSDLRDDASLGGLDEGAIEAVAAADEERARLHRVNDARRNLLRAAGTVGETRVRARHGLEPECEDHRAAPIHGALDVDFRHAGPTRYLRETIHLHRMLRALVADRGPALGVRSREHRGVLAGAVVVKPRRTFARFAEELLPAGCDGIVRSARPLTPLPAERREHSFRDCDVLRLAASRAACERELVVAPADAIESAARDERHHLERLRAGAPIGDERRVADTGHEVTSGIDDRRMYAGPRLHERPAWADDVQ